MSHDPAAMPLSASVEKVLCLAVTGDQTPPASYPFFLPLNLESKTQVREEQQRGKRDNAAPSSGSLEP